MERKEKRKEKSTGTFAIWSCHVNPILLQQGKPQEVDMKARSVFCQKKATDVCQGLQNQLLQPKFLVATENNNNFRFPIKDICEGAPLYVS